MNQPGFTFYVGEPHTGKTYLALYRAAESRRPLLMIDSTGARPLPHMPPLVNSRHDAIKAVWGRGEACRYIPKSVKDVDAIFAGCKPNAARIGVCILVDELSFWTSSAYAPPNMEDCIRTNQHVNLDVHVTTQAPQDIPPRLRNCASAVVAFRCSDDRVLSILKGRFPNDVETIRTLPNHKAVEWKAQG